ncbi:3D domain-containing protein [Ammoniphilus sp. CFH 90114]|uniref:3D domain-containing protein n=1 Tax=Ammoniphilus sp. CFH 90114 TaxID=2493665 RepID=UPI001F0CC38A|nr:3D domain-containing protein [Ammoniphilus sp. CFH 90114]
MKLRLLCRSFMSFGLLAFILVFSTTESSAFSDFNETYWAKPHLVRLAEKNLLVANGPNYYPRAEITKEEFLSMATKILNLHRGSNSRQDKRDGFGFLTREEMVTIAAHLKQPDKKKQKQTPHPFKDDKAISKGARKSVYIAVQQGWISGMEDHYFAPKKRVTRAEAAVLLDRMAFGNPPPLNEKIVSVSGSHYEYKTKMSMKSTAYGPHVGSRTATGKKVKFGMIAVDPKVIALGTKVYVTGYQSPYLPSEGFLAVAEDTGGAIKGKKIDIFINQSRRNIMKYGVQQVDVYILKD